MVIEDARPEDLPAIRQLLAQCLLEEYGQLHDLDTLWARYLAASPRTVLVARHDAKLTGFIWLVAGDDPVTGTRFDYVFYLAVDPAWRRQGIASALLERCQSGRTPLRLLARQGHPAESLYRQQGFRARAREWEWPT